MMAREAAGGEGGGKRVVELDTLDSLEDAALLGGRLPSSGDAVFSLGDSEDDED